MATVKIACPKCNWEPQPDDHWHCTCGHAWNTFDTAARCPSCGRQWEETQCLTTPGGCGQFSPHINWYKGLDKWLLEELKKISVPVEEPAF